MKARYTRQARLAVRQIILSIAEHSPSGAQAVSKRIERGVHLIEDFSRAGVDTSLPRVRKLSLPPTPPSFSTPSKRTTSPSWPSGTLLGGR